nr:apolipoprotein N-acyltransferase [Oceaniglobus trochenteri]
MLARATRRQIAVLAIGAGILAGFGQVPFSQPHLGLAGFALLCALLIDRAGWRAAAFAGWCAGIGYFALTLHWIVEPFLVDVARHGWMAPFALILSATGFALFWGLGAAIAALVTPPGAWRLIAFPLALSAAEMLRGYVLTGFPWALPGYVFSEGIIARGAALVGSYGLSLLVLAMGAVCVAALRWRTWAGVAVLAALVLLPRLGETLWPQVFAAGGPGAPVIRLIQPNAPQEEKWDPDRALMFFDRQLEYTAAPGMPDLTVWPETSIPWAAEPGHPALADISRAAGGRPVVIGAQRFDGLRAFNSALLLGEGGEIVTTYDKHHLVPFGEFIPLGQLARAVGLRSFAARDGFGFTAGPGPQVIDLGPLGKALPLICYEAVFPQDLRGTTRPDWLLQITNDAWFGTFAGPQQHLAQARMRAIEQGLPLVRVANTGISAVIDAHGVMGPSLALGVAGHLDVALPRALAPTLYSRTGDLPLALLLIVLLGGLMLLRLRNGD